MIASVLSQPLKPVITTVIPTYRRPGLLRRAILSVLGQTYPHVRVCVCDNASGDETEAVVAELARRDSRVQYHHHQENIGSYNNFNYGIQCVETPYFSLLSDDDVLAPDFYSQAMMAFDRYPDAMFVCMPTLVVNLDFEVVAVREPISTVKYVASGHGIAGLVDGSIPSQWTGILFRKEVKDGIGVTDVGAGPFTDVAYVLHAAARYPFVAIPGIAAILVVHPDTISGTVKPLDGTWPGWWEKMVSAVTEDQHVPQFARDKIRSLIYPSFRRIAAYQVLRALGEEDPVIAGQTAAGLRQCGHAFCAYVLGFVVWTYQYVSVVRRILSLVNRHRKNATRQRISELTVRFGHHVEFIRQLESVKGGPSD